MLQSEAKKRRLWENKLIPDLILAWTCLDSKTEGSKPKSCVVLRQHSILTFVVRIKQRLNLVFSVGWTLFLWYAVDSALVSPQVVVQKRYWYKWWPFKFCLWCVSQMHVFFLYFWVVTVKWYLPNVEVNWILAPIFIFVFTSFAFHLFTSKLTNCLKCLKRSPQKTTGDYNHFKRIRDFSWALDGCGINPRG